MYGPPMMMPPGGGGGDEMILLVMMMFCCMFSVIAGAGWYFLMAPEEGDECSGKDENGNYVIDDKGKCVLYSCNTGYYKSGKECLVDQSGKDCEGSDPNAEYETDVSNVCTFVMCDYGYNIGEDGNCVEVEDDGSSADGGSGNGSSADGGSGNGSGADGGGGGGSSGSCVKSTSKTACNVTCGGGTKTKTTTWVATGGATSCPSPSTIEIPCNSQSCSVAEAPAGTTS